MSKSSIWHQIFAATAASLSLVCAGMHYGWPMFDLLRTIEESSSSLYTHYFWSSLLLLASAICGPLLGLLLVSTLGRRTTLLLMMISPFVSCVLILLARSFVMLYLARFIAGIGVGIAFMVTPMYIGEIADRSIRGGLCVLISVMFDLGCILSPAIATATSTAALAVVGVVVPIVVATALLWSPESPYHFAMNNDPKGIQESVAWLRGTPDVLREVQEIRNSVALNRRGVTNLLNLFRVSSNRKALFIIIGLFSFKELSYVAAQIQKLSLADTSFGLPYTLIPLITGICVIFLVDKLGRRPLLLASTVLGVIISLVPVLIQISGMDWIYGLSSMIPVLLQLAGSSSLSIGLRTLPFVVAGEIFSTEVKTFALAISFSVYFIVVLGIAYIASYAYEIGSAVCFIPPVVNIISGVFIYFAVPETKGRSLSEIQTPLQGHFGRQV